MRTEIAEACERAEARINSEDFETAISDAIADLMTLAYERDIDAANVIVRGVAHAVAAYMESATDMEADAIVNEFLFPFTGERQFAEYIAEQAIVLSGKAGRVHVPAWGA